MDKFILNNNLSKAKYRTFNLMAFKCKECGKFLTMPGINPLSIARMLKVDELCRCDKPVVETVFIKKEMLRGGFTKNISEND